MSTGQGRVVILGCGAIGSVIAGHLAASDRVKDLLLADLDPIAPETLRRRLGRSERVRTQALDVSDAAALEQALAGASVVVQSSLPRFNRAIKSAALAQGVDYVDLACESTDPYADSAEWSQLGRLAVVGMGEDPGLSNLMARNATDAMESVESIRVRDGDSASSPELPFLPLFSPETFIEETLAASRIWDGSAYRSVPPFGEKELYSFPEPVGTMPVYSVDHEEVDSLPRFIGKGVRYVDFKLALDDVTVRTLQLFRDLKLLERGTPDRPGPRRALLAALPKPADLGGKVTGYACLVVEVVGRRGGLRCREVRSTSLSHAEAFQRFGTTATAHLTGTPAAVAVLLMLEGRVEARGVLAPESLDPLPFFGPLADRGIEVRASSTVERALSHG